MSSITWQNLDIIKLKTLCVLGKEKSIIDTINILS